MDSGSEKIFIDKYIIDPKNKLGGGAFGEVYLGYYQPGKGPKDTPLAIKESVIPEGSANSEIFKKATIQEIRCMNDIAKYNHPNIVKLIDAKKKGNKFYTIMEYCDQGSLHHFILQNPNLSEQEILYYFLQVVEAFKCLHMQKIIHRDLKPENILMKENTIKLCDFGLAKHFYPNANDNHTIVGTQNYMSPQLLKGENNYSDKADIWSLGVTLYWMLFRKFYWESKQKGNLNQYTLRKLQKDIAKQIKEQQEIDKGDPIKYFPFGERKITTMTKKLIIRMLEFEEKDRISFEELFEFCEKNIKIEDIGLTTISKPSTNKSSGQGAKKQDEEKSDVIQEGNLEAIDSSQAALTPNDINEISQFLNGLNNKKAMSEMANKVQCRLDYERNIVILFWNCIRRISKIYTEEKFIPYGLFIRIQFLFMKRIYIHYKILSEMLNTKQNVLDIPLNEWESFLNCHTPNLYQKITEKINDDCVIYEKNFDSFLAMAEKALLAKNCSDQDKQKLKQIISKDILIDENFQIHLENEVVALIGVFKTKMEQYKEHFDFLSLLDDMLIILTLKTSLPWKPQNPINMNKFYENRRFTQPQCLFQRIQDALKTLNL